MLALSMACAALWIGGIKLRRKFRKERHPISEKIRRSPGYSLRLEVDQLQETYLEWVGILGFAPMFLTACVFATSKTLISSCFPAYWENQTETGTASLQRLGRAQQDFAIESSKIASKRELMEKGIGNIIQDPGLAHQIFMFDLLIFHTTNMERTSGITSRFGWDSNEKNLVFKAREMTERPILEKDHLRVLFSGQQVWYDGKQCSEVPRPLIEAFLNDAYRLRIVEGLADKGRQRIEVLRWLVENEFPIYRHLRTPVDSQGAYEEIVFSPKLDFLTNS
jgi:hypothetical protein